MLKPLTLCFKCAVLLMCCSFISAPHSIDSSMAFSLSLLLSPPMRHYATPMALYNALSPTVAKLEKLSLIAYGIITSSPLIIKPHVYVTLGT